MIKGSNSLGAAVGAETLGVALAVPMDRDLLLTPGARPLPLMPLQLLETNLTTTFGWGWRFRNGTPSLAVATTVAVPHCCRIRVTTVVPSFTFLRRFSRDRLARFLPRRRCAGRRSTRSLTRLRSGGSRWRGLDRRRRRYRFRLLSPVCAPWRGRVRSRTLNRFPSSSTG